MSGGQRAARVGPDAEGISAANRVTVMKPQALTLVRYTEDRRRCYGQDYAPRIKKDGEPKPTALASVWTVDVFDVSVCLDYRRRPV